MREWRAPIGACSRLVLCVAAMTLASCAALPPNSFLDPTAVGQFPLEYKEAGIRRILTPRDTPPGVEGATEPTPEDLVPSEEDYRIGPNDEVAVLIDDLIVEREQFQARLEVSSSGYIRLPTVGSIKAADLTEQELEQEISAQLKQAQVLPNPVVQVSTLTRRDRIFYIIGSVSQAGPYAITVPDLRLLDAIGLARDIGPEVKRLYVIRQQNGGAKTNGVMDEIDGEEPAEKRDDIVVPPPGEEEANPGSFFATVGAPRQDKPKAGRPPDEDPELEGLLNPPKRKPAAEPEPRQKSFDPVTFEFDPKTGQLAEKRPEPKPAQPEPGRRTGKNGAFDWGDVPELELTQRVIEIDAQALKTGDARYNIVIRDRDMIQVPVDTGVFYLAGQVNRPGVYGFSGRDITIKQAVAIAGGLAQLAWPQRTEIIRKESGTDKQITIPINLDAIFAGLEEDLYLRDDDIVNVGTHIAAPFLFIIRNSFRFTYGFGFVYDRNFADKDAFGGRQNPEVIALQRRQQRGLPF
ncbi:Polysaccharide biosynthesis/export protein [Phycisphaerae bacterium RAS1]|nr:Polysaccharide biosynthesis/export protein [Phycisphaerae bacterium RAS1]